ncbi:MAG: hypothetical protein ACE5K7_05500 [Phycisphaerae bacterium]
MSKFDPFIFFRTALFVFLAIYSVLSLGSTVWRLKGLFAGGQATKRMLRLYVSYQLLTIRLRPARSELAQIVFCLMLLSVLWWLHRLI